MTNPNHHRRLSIWLALTALLLPLLAACSSSLGPDNPRARAYFESTPPPIDQPAQAEQSQTHDHSSHSHSDPADTHATAQPDTAGSGVPENGTVSAGDEVRVIATDFTFEPTEVNLQAGKPVKLVLENRGQFPHDISIFELGVKAVAAPGESATTTVTAKTAGSYKFFCSVPGHEQAGMVGMASAPSDGGLEQATTGKGHKDEHPSHAAVATTAKHGNQPLKHRVEKGVKVFDLKAQHVKWEVLPNEFIDAYAYNGQVPGALIRVTEGDKLRVNLKNELPEPTALHFHGPRLPNKMDGVPDVTQKVIEPGQTFPYEFVASPPGVFVYHTHHNSAVQEPKGLYGVLIIDPKGAPKAADKELIQVLGETEGHFLINGKAFPATEPIEAKVGEKLLVRLINMGQMTHPMHMHGHPFKIMTTDGYPVPKGQELMKDVVNIGPGERYDLLLELDNPGTWVFHCHILSHSANKGVEPGGMITVLKVTR